MCQALIRASPYRRAIAAKMPNSRKKSREFGIAHFCRETSREALNSGSLLVWLNTPWPAIVGVIAARFCRSFGRRLRLVIDRHRSRFHLALFSRRRIVDARIASRSICLVGSLVA